MSKFLDDLARGKEMELIVMELLKEKINKNLIINPHNKWVDILIIKGWIEVKFDSKAQVTGNFYVEYECNKKPSWIFKEEEYNLEYWCHTDWITLYVVRWDTLKDFITYNIKNPQKEIGIKLTNWGDGFKTKGVLIPINIMDDLSIHKFTI